MNRKKHKLALSFSEDYCVLGIVSDDPDYKLCWHMNEKLQLTFAKKDDLSLFHKKLNETDNFPLFYYQDESAFLNYRFIGNKSETAWYLPELKHIDYILHIQGEVNELDVEDLIKRLLKIESIRMCVPVDHAKIKEKERLELW